MLPIRFSIVEAEVRQVFRNKPRIRKVEKGDVKNEDLYSALGQTDSGRYLIIYFIYKLSQDALVISSRDMDDKEKRRYGKKT
jgi:uncharacterized DUF497 family protein